MSKWIIDPVVIYSPSSGETIATAWQKQIKIDDDLLAMINRLRTMDASAGANVSDAEAFQLKINTTDKTLLIRNTTNTEWIVCGYIDKEFLGITPETIHAIKNNGGVNSIKTVQDIPSGGNNGDLALDINNKKLYQKNDGIWSLLLSLSAKDLLDYKELIKRDETSDCGEANKIPIANILGKLPNDITGSPDKLADKIIIADGLKDGMVFVYRSSANDGEGGFVPEGVTASSFIDDTEVSLSKTYSSSKINEKFDDITSNIESSIDELSKTTNDNLFDYTRTRKNSFEYKYGDIAYLPSLASYIRLECCQEGTTAETTPEEFNSTQVGQYVTDGTVKWIVCDIRDGLSLGDITYRPILKTGYVKLNGATVQREDYPRLVLYATLNSLFTADNSTTPWLFGNGDGDTTFVLPDYRNVFIEGGDTPSKIEAGLPNITGYIGAYMGTAPIRSVNGTGNGALYIKEDNLKGLRAEDLTSGATLGIDASKSNSIYGNSTTVQPPAIVLIPQIKY